jgi:hypothetical protein
MCVDTVRPKAGLACNKFTEDFRDFLVNYSLSLLPDFSIPLPFHERIKYPEIYVM